MATAAPPALDRFRDAVVHEMRDTLRTHDQSIYGLQRYHLGWQAFDGVPTERVTGKMFRAALCLLCCEAVGGDFERALPAAAAIEFLHNFSLIHDDIEDVSRSRHGQRTVWDVWGVARGINAGDSMFVVARMALHRLAAHGYESQTLVNAFLLFDRASQRLCEGQDLDLSFEDRESVSMDEYQRMIAGKTGALIGASASLGALLGDAPAPTVALFDRFGRLLGRAFQIQDDILGVWGLESRTGKPSGSDIRSRKKAYPVVRALELLSPGQRSRLLGIFAQPELDDAAVEEVLSILDEHGIRTAAETEAVRAATDAIALISQATLVGPVRRELTALAEFVADRDA